MVSLGKTEKIYNKDKKTYYMVPVSLNRLSDLKWINSFASSCHSTYKKTTESETNDKNQIKIVFFFKHEKYYERFRRKVKNYISYQVND